MLPGLIIIQVTLGAFTVLSQKNVGITTAHVAVGALLMMSCALILVELGKLLGWRTQRIAIVVPASEATI